MKKQKPPIKNVNEMNLRIVDLILDKEVTSVETIEKFGNFEGFVEGIPFDGPYITNSKELKEK